jgi:hypothetical protein
VHCIGVDYHKKYSYAVVKDREGKVERRGKVFHGRITKTGNKWLRWAFIEAVQPAISCDADLFAYYQWLRMRKDANAAKTATARRLLTIVFHVLSQERLCQRNRRTKTNRVPVALITS